MKVKKSVSFLTLFLLCLTFVGCKDKTELEEQGYVSTIGIDRGRDNNLRITFQLINVKYGASTGKSSGGSDQAKTETLTFDCPDIISGRDLANVSVARRISLSQARVLVVGEELAREQRFFHLLEAPLRERELRRGIDLIISRESAESFITNNNPKLEDRVNKFYDFMSNRWKDTGFVPVSDVNKFMQRSEENRGLFLAVYGSTKKFELKLKGGNEADYLPGQVDIQGSNPAELIGSAVFKSGQMIGVLTGEETRLVALLRAKTDIHSMIFTFPDPKSNNFRITTRLTKSKKTKVKVDVKGPKPVVDVTVPIEIEVLSIPSFYDYVETLNNEKLLKDYLAKYLKERAEFLIAKTQKTFKGDPFQWHYQLRKNFRTFNEYEDYNWLQKYSSAEVKVKFDIKLKGFGKQLAPPEGFKTKEEKEGK